MQEQEAAQQQQQRLPKILSSYSSAFKPLPQQQQLRRDTAPGPQVLGLKGKFQRKSHDRGAGTGPPRPRFSTVPVTS
ncbi:MAG: hypothetical protein ACK559_37130, partial [bacterium]